MSRDRASLKASAEGPAIRARALRRRARRQGHVTWDNVPNVTNVPSGDRRGSTVSPDPAADWARQTRAITDEPNR
jgi:hypothetical protein